MGWSCDEGPDVVVDTPKSIQMEKHEMVSFPANRNDETCFRKSYKMEASVVMAQ